MTGQKDSPPTGPIQRFSDGAKLLLRPRIGEIVRDASIAEQSFKANAGVRLIRSDLMAVQRSVDAALRVVEREFRGEFGAETDEAKP